MPLRAAGRTLLKTGTLGIISSPGDTQKPRRMLL